MHFQQITHPDDLQLNMKDLQRVLRGEIDHYQVEKRYIHKDGRIVPTSLTASVVRNDRGRPLYFVSQLQDLTEQRNAQVEIEHLRIELARFGRAALTGQLSAALAHQLMQPLAAAIGNTQVQANDQCGPALTARSGKRSRTSSTAVRGPWTS